MGLLESAKVMECSNDAGGGSGYRTAKAYLRRMAGNLSRVGGFFEARPECNIE